MRIHTSRFRAALLASIAVAGVASAATAQTAAAPAAAPSAAADDESIIIVTASKRTATLQDTPISVAVTGRAQIENSQIRDLKDLSTLVPSLRVSQLQSSANTNFIIRGFGNGANNAGIEPSVGVFIDGVYRSRSAAQIGDLPDLERIEVLRGPQSTLFGKNASAGIISIVTREPQFDFGGNAEIGYGNYNAIVGKASITGPINDKIAFSVAGNFNKRDGYGQDLNLKTDINDRNRWGVRGSLLFKPSDDLKIRLIADYDKIDENCCLVANLVDGPTGNAVRALGGKIPSAQPLSYTQYTNIKSTNKIENYGFSAQGDWNVNDTLTFTGIGSYRAVRSLTNQDSDFTSADLIGSNINDTKINTYTAEARLASSYDGFFNFLIGGFYFNEKIASDGNLTFGKDFKGYANLLSGGAYSSLEPTLRALVPVPAGAFGSQGQGRFEHYDYKNEAFSIFGQADFEITEGLVFTAGGNYTNDRKTVATNNVSTDSFSAVDLVRAGVAAGVPAALATNPKYNPFLGLAPLQFIPPFLNFPNAVEDGKTHDDNFSYTLRLAYKFNDHLSTYGTYATGFKASSWNLSIDSRPFANTFIPGSPYQAPAPAASPIRSAGLALNNLTTGTRYAGPENAEVYEAGLKGQFDGFNFNLAVFKQALKGFQGNVFVGTGFVLSNAEKQSTFGIELDTMFSPVKNLNVTFNMTYLDPKFDSYTGGSELIASGVCKSTGATLSYGTCPTDLSGQKPAGIPEFSVAVGTTYTHEFSDSLRAIAHVDFNHESPVTIAQGLPTWRRQVDNLNGSLTFALTNIGKGLELSLWGRNITNQQTVTVVFPSVAQSGSLSGYPSQPRTWGGLVRFRF